MISINTNHPCLRVGHHSWYQSITSVINDVRSHFHKPTLRIRLYAHVRTIVVLTGGKLTRIYFQHLLYAICYCLMTHLRQSKRVSFLLSGDVNPGPVPSRRGLLADGPYHAVRAMCLLIDWPLPRT
jgi:hypothetical protein